MCTVADEARPADGKMSPPPAAAWAERRTEHALPDLESDSKSSPRWIVDLINGVDNAEVEADNVALVSATAVPSTAYGTSSMPPVYDPPYESPLEDIFAWNIVKYLDSRVQFVKQVEVETNCGVFRMDFIACLGSRTIGFECDGEEFHGRFGSLRDEWRDAVIMAVGSAKAIYRLRGKDLTYHMEDCLSCIAECDPALFSERGIRNLETLISEPARHILAARDSSAPEHCMFIGYPESRNEYGIRVERRTIGSPYFRTWIDYITAHGGGNLDALMNTWWEERKQKAVQG